MNKLDIDQLKRSTNIVDFIGKYVPLKKQGKNYFGCCPFHGENTASFSVDANKQFYHCFGCGVNGDILQFIMDYMNVDFKEAAKVIGGVIEVTPDEKLLQNINRSRVSLPLNKEPHSVNEMTRFLVDKCEKLHDCYFFDSNQVIFLTDINKNKVSLAMIQGKGFEIRHYKKEFLHGSCFIFGDIKADNITYLCEDYFTALQLHLKNECAICFFQASNLYFIVEELKRKTSNFVVVADTQEVVNLCNDMNLLDCHYQEIGNKVCMS